MPFSVINGKLLIKNKPFLLTQKIFSLFIPNLYGCIFIQPYKLGYFFSGLKAWGENLTHTKP